MSDQPKRGRGRPKKLRPEDLKFAEPTEKDIEWAKEKITQYRNSQSQPETPYPKDWDTMSKTEKLAWYTENKK